MKTYKNIAGQVVQMNNLKFNPSLLQSYRSKTVLDELLCSYSGLPKGVNYMIIGDPGVGKTTIVLDMLANIQKQSPNARILFISAEMNEIDLFIYIKRYPKFGSLNIMFVESDFDQEFKYWEILNKELVKGWDIVAIDSFLELQGIIKEEEDVRMKEAESMIISLIKQQNKAHNKRQKHTTFLTIQQVTKAGNFVGSNRLKHSITAMMELRLDNPKNIYSDRYITFSKHRRGDVGVQLFYSLTAIGDVEYDHERFEQDKRLRQRQQEIANSIRDFADEFDELFT